MQHQGRCKLVSWGFLPCLSLTKWIDRGGCNGKQLWDGLLPTKQFMLFGAFLFNWHDSVCICCTTPNSWSWSFTPVFGLPKNGNLRKWIQAKRDLLSVSAWIEEWIYWSCCEHPGWVHDELVVMDCYGWSSNISAIICRHHQATTPLRSVPHELCKTVGIMTLAY